MKTAIALLFLYAIPVKGSSTHIIDSIVVSPATCNGCCDGIAIAYVSGGTGSFTYVWQTPCGPQGPTGNIDTCSGICAGTFILEVIDNGTFASIFDVYNVTEPPVGISEREGNNIVTISFISSYQFIILSDDFEQPAFFELYDLMGKKVYKQLVARGQMRIDIRNLARGVYIWSIGNTRSKVVIE